MRATSKSIPSFEIWPSNVNPQILLMNSSKSKKRSVFTASEGDCDVTHPALKKMYPIYARLSSVCKSLLHFGLMYVVQWFLSYFLSTGVNMRGVGLK